MRLSVFATLSALLAIVTLVSAGLGQPPVKSVSERQSWDAAFLMGAKAGHFQFIVQEIEQDGRKVRRAARKLDLTMKRFGEIVRVVAEVGTIESADGKVLGVFMTQGLGQNQQLALQGVVNGNRLEVTTTGSAVPDGKIERSIPWDDTVIGLIGEENLLKDRQAKPGDKFNYRMFEPTVNNIVTTQVTVKDWETVVFNGVNRKLLRVELKPDRIQDVQLPPQTIWVDKDFSTVRSQVEMPGLGELTLVRTSKAEALKPVGQLRDMADLQSIVLNRSIPQPHQQSKIVYRIRLTKSEDPAMKLLSNDDGRQTISNVNGLSFEVRIDPVRSPGKGDPKAKPPKEYLESNFFVNSADKVVRKLSDNAVGTEQDDWRKAQLIERWVHRNMRVLSFSEAMATSDHVARTLEGDCTEFSVLTAAMCKAAGIPARTAIGLVYYTDRQVAKLGYHMWIEVWIRGQWIGLDATLGQGSVGPAHIKITDHSWHEVRSMIPLLPVMRFMGTRPKVEVLEVGANR